MTEKSDRDREIADIDGRILELISRRSELCIDRKKAMDGSYVPEEDQRIGELIREKNRGPLSVRSLETIFTEIRSAAMAAAAPVKVSYLGPEGTFSWIALQESFGSSIEPLPAKTIPDVFRSVEKGESRYGIVPVENSTEGAVTFTLDELMETDLRIIGEKYVRITYSILSLASSMTSIKKVYSHPQPLGQCKTWLRTNIPGAQVIDVSSTTHAAELASRDPEAAALSSQVAADLYGLHVLATAIEDSRQNFTRFFIIGREGGRPTGKDKTSIVCAVKDKPGALLMLLQPLSSAGINMTKIESRPDKKKIWAYNFFIDVQGHIDEAGIAGAIDKMREESIFLKILGSYPAGN